MQRLVLAVLFAAALPALAFGQGGPRPADLGASPQGVGEPGVAWYARWDDAKAEALRSGRPIFFMAAAAQCGGVSGVF